ncbi:AraC family transcriptional regulator [Dyadobacter sp. CY327]|uniref:helix-turn-helix transcriptional regulator n=1 Tax=Dyadobacter sp. CY327 TaxID=2907301 RepID=UPI001F23981E|nr:AraC family transcriptional regulator [Dyadobacter sp. CY327]MCE7072182.1 AraC family transcriptional regulator [Dyadobacter sp. CY327]
MEELTQELVNETGKFRSVSWCTDDLRVSHNISQYQGSERIPISRRDDVVRLHFGLKGDYQFTHQQLNKRFDLVGSHQNMMYSEGFDIILENKTPQVETFGIQFSKASFISFAQNADNQLEDFCEAVISGKSIMLSKNWGSINPAIENVIRQVIHCPYNGGMKQIFILSKCLELLVLSAESSLKNAGKRAYVLTRQDKEKIIAVRDLINGRLESPPTLSEIGKLVGMNEFKLKHGFKEMFQTTIFGYLTDQRLNTAFQYLRDTQKTAAEVAFELGYATPQHFNNAFKKRFGVTPNLVRNNP